MGCAAATTLPCEWQCKHCFTSRLIRPVAGADSVRYLSAGAFAPRRATAPFMALSTQSSEPTGM